MRTVMTQEWIDDVEGHAGSITAYSLHLNEKDRDLFSREREDTGEFGGRNLRPIGRWVVVGVDDEIYEKVRNSPHGMWYDGKAYWGGKEYELGSRSN